MPFMDLEPAARRTTDLIRAVPDDPLINRVTWLGRRDPAWSPRPYSTSMSEVDR